MSTKLRLPLDVTWEKGQTCCNAMDTQTVEDNYGKNPR